MAEQGIGHGRRLAGLRWSQNKDRHDDDGDDDNSWLVFIDIAALVVVVVSIGRCMMLLNSSDGLGSGGEELAAWRLAN